MGIDAEEWSKLVDSLPATIEPGVPQHDYRTAAEHFLRMEKQQLLLYVDELIERHSELLSNAKIQFVIDDDRVDWGSWKIVLQSNSGETAAASMLDAIEMIVVDIVVLFQHFETPVTAEMIVDLVYEFGELGWTPDALIEVLPCFAETLGIVENADAWITRHRSHRQAMRLASTMPQAVGTSARQRF